MRMNAIELALVGMIVVFSTLSVLAIVTYIIGKIIVKIGREDKRRIAAMVAKLRAEGRL